MDIYKLRPGLQPVHKINKDKFEADTGKRAPWYQREGDKIVQFAVCPACDNPIRIVALYERHEKSPKPYGKHTPKHIVGLATYDQAAYDECPYACPNREFDRERRRPESDPRGKDILQLLREQFDRVIYLLEHCTGIYIRSSLARKMLDSFLGMRGHLYVRTNLCNLPWMFGYMTTSQNLFGVEVNKDSQLMNALKNNEHILITNDSKVKSMPREFIDINFCFMNYKTVQSSLSYSETIDFQVSLNGENIFQKTIEMNPMHFHNLVNLSPERAKRKEHLLAIAAEMIPV